MVEEKQLMAYFINSSVAIVVLSAIYGAIMGLYPGDLQILYDAIKIPMLLLMPSKWKVASSYPKRNMPEAIDKGENNEKQNKDRNNAIGINTIS